MLCLWAGWYALLERLGLSKTIRLTKVAKGTWVEIVSVCIDDPAQSNQLMHMGLYTGARVGVHQTYPAYVIVADEATIALEFEMVEKIIVKGPETTSK